MAADAQINIGADATAFSRTLAKMSQDMDTMANSISARLARLGQAFKGLKDFGGTVKSVISGIGDFANVFIEPAAAAQTMHLSFKIMLGSEKKAIEFMDGLNTFASTTPFTLDQVSNAAKTLLSNTSLGEQEVMSLLEKIGNMASLTGSDMNEISRVYAKAFNVGVTNEVAESFETMGVAVRKTIAELQGITFQEVKDKISNGELSIVHLNAALNSLTGAGGKFAGGMSQLSETYSGKISTLCDNWTQALRTIGAEILPYITEVAGKLTNALQEAMPAIERIGIMFGEWLGEKVRDSTIPAIDELIVSMPQIGVYAQYVARKFQDLLDIVLAIPNAFMSVQHAGAGFVERIYYYLNSSMDWEQAGDFTKRMNKALSAEGMRDLELANLKKQSEEQRAEFEERRKRRKKEAEERDRANEELRASAAEAAAASRKQALEDMAADEKRNKAIKQRKKLIEDNAKAAEKYEEARDRYDIERAKKKYDKLSIPARERSLRRQGEELGVDGTLSPESIRARMDALAEQGASANEKEIDALQRLLTAWDELADRKREYARTRMDAATDLRADALQTLGNDRAARKLREQAELEKRVRELREQGSTAKEARAQATAESKVREAREMGERLKARRREFIQGNLTAVGGGGGSLRVGEASLAEARRHSSLLKDVISILSRIENRKQKTTAVLA